MPRSYSMATRTVAAAAVRDQILEATLDELAAVGSEVTMSGVAKRADVALRTLYNHYASRDELLTAAYLRHAEQARAAVEAVTLPDASPPEQLRDVVRAYYSSYAHQGPRLTTLLSLRDVPELEEQIGQIRAQRRAVLTQIVDRARRTGVLAIPARTAVALAFTMTGHAAWQMLVEELGGVATKAAAVAGDALTAALFRR